MFKKLLVIALVLAVLYPSVAKAVMETESYNHNPFEEKEGIHVENTEDFTVLFLILLLLVLILYKGEATLENLIKMKEKREVRKILKNKRKEVRKRVKKKYERSSRKKVGEKKTGKKRSRK